MHPQGMEDPFGRWRVATVYELKFETAEGTKFYCGYSTHMEVRKESERNKSHAWCPNILKQRLDGTDIEYTHEKQLVGFWEFNDEDRKHLLRRQARTRELIHTAKLIQSKGRQMVNGAIWLLAAEEPLGPSVLERVKKELERAKFFFNQLPDEVWLAESTSAIFQTAEQLTAEYAAEFPEVQDFLNAEGKWKPRRKQPPREPRERREQRDPQQSKRKAREQRDSTKSNRKRAKPAPRAEPAP